jgi:hypothetical protein
MELVAKAANRHPYDSEVVYHTCLFFSAISIPDALKADVGKAGGIELVVAALLFNPTHNGIATAACSALQNATHIPENEARAVACGAPAALGRALAQHGDSDRPTALSAIRAIGYCSRTQPQTQVLTPLMADLVAHWHDPERAAALGRSLFYCVPMPEQQAAFGRQPNAPAAVAAMVMALDAHAGDDTAVRGLGFALARLTATEGNSVTPLAAQAGGIAAAIKALQARQS